MSGRPHGTRAKYVAEKCRCDDCRAANAAYTRERLRNEARVRYGIAEPTVAYVDATEARDHLRWLRSVGIGKCRVHELTGVALSSIEKIRSGKVTKCRPRTAEKILGVRRSLAAGGANVDATKTWKQIEDLLAAGYTKTWIAKQLGSKAKVPTLQVGRKQVLASTARKVDELHERLLFRLIQQRRVDNERQIKYRERKAAA